jgi:hypothetical protein
MSCDWLKPVFLLRLDWLFLSVIVSRSLGEGRVETINFCAVYILAIFFDKSKE